MVQSVKQMIAKDTDKPTLDNRVKELEAKLADTNDFLEHYIKEASDWHNAAKAHFSRMKELEVQNEIMKSVLTMVEDNSKMPHVHLDPLTRLYCLAERAREALAKINGAKSE